MNPVIERGRQRVKTTPDAPRLAIGLPVRRESPVEFWMSMLQMLPPLNVKLSYIIQKGANARRVEAYEDVRAAMRAALTEPGVEVCEPCGGSGRVRIADRGSLGAEARNKILRAALDQHVQYVMFFDDDVLFPDMTVYRLWIEAQKRPDAACLTAVYPTKVSPCEPLLYQDDASGAWWDWPLGAVTPIHSAGAGAMLVNLAYVAKLDEPWFNDVVRDTDGSESGYYRRHTWGHDRFFHIRLREEAGGTVYADTGLLCAHWDTETQRSYVVPPDAPCFQRPAEGEAFVPFLDAQGVVEWRRLLPRAGGDERFRGYLEWLAQGASQAGTKLDLVREGAR